MQNRSLKIISTSLAFLLSGTATLTAEELTSGPLACDFSQEKSELVTVKITNGDIEGAILKMPRDYVTSAGFKNGEQRKALLLRAYNTDFSAYPNNELLTSEGKSKSLAGIHDKLSILISGNVPMNEIALNHVYLNYGLERKFSILEVEHKNFANGLYVLPYPTREKRNEIFLGISDINYTDVISCNRDEDAPYPQCSHIFEAGAYDVKISYSKTQLHRWRDLRGGINHLLQCFTIKQPIQRGEN